MSDQRDDPTPAEQEQAHDLSIAIIRLADASDDKNIAINGIVHAYLMFCATNNVSPYRAIAIVAMMLHQAQN